MDSFLDERRLLLGPWQAFERDVARLLIVIGFDDVRVVGGTGDKGADVLGVKDGDLWVIQCKHTTTSIAQSIAIKEVVNAAQFYGAQRMIVALSRPVGDSFLLEKMRYERLGYNIDLLEPAQLLDLMEKVNDYSPLRKKLYTYQNDAVMRFREALLDTGKAQMVLATGLGKTVIMAELISDLLRDNLIPNQRVLVLAHTCELIDQLQKSFWYQLPKYISTHRLAEGESPTYWDGITFATIQSIVNRLDSLTDFDMILVDEAHHIGSDSYKKAINHIQPKFLGGVTATPWRGDDYDIGHLLGPPVFRMGIAEGLQQGFLSDVDYRMLGDNLDWSFIQQLSKHKYSINQLNKRLIISIRDEEAARIIADNFRSEKCNRGIIYSPSKIHANAFAAYLRQYNFKVETISSDCDPKERYRLMSHFRSGKLDFVATVDLFNEGVDVPDVDCIVFMRATHSRRIFVQQLGRGLRLSPNKKRVLVLDFVTDIRRVAEIVDLDKAVRGCSIEHLGLGNRLIQFANKSAGNFLREWMLDQASLFLREDENSLELPQFDFPNIPLPGGIQ
jgi:superfamily II DNA or RNA helicase